MVMIAPMQQAEAATVTYTNRMAWQNAASVDVLLENFDVPNTGNQDVLSFPNVDVISSGLPATANNRNRISGGRFRGTLNTSNPNRYDSIVWTFGGAGVHGFFADFFSVDNGISITGDYDLVVGSSDSTIDLRAALGGASGGFGLLSDTRFKTIAFNYTGSGNAGFSVDNLAVDVPTPALLPGIIGMGIAAMRKKDEVEVETEEA